MRNPTLPFVGSLAASAVMLSLTAQGGTPDGVEPSREEVCDAWRGAAFGLCNAYCEAMDCDDPRVHAADPACESVAARFARVTGGDELPCETPPPPACEVDAQDDWFFLYDDGVFTVDVFENDLFTPADADVTITEHTAPPDILLADDASGLFTGQWDDIEAYRREFTYTVCCAPDVCDSATVTILGS